MNLGIGIYEYFVNGNADFIIQILFVAIYIGEDKWFAFLVFNGFRFESIKQQFIHSLPEILEALLKADC